MDNTVKKKRGFYGGVNKKGKDVISSSRNLYHPNSEQGIFLCHKTCIRYFQVGSCPHNFSKNFLTPFLHTIYFAPGYKPGMK